MNQAEIGTTAAAAVGGGHDRAGQLGRRIRRKDDAPNARIDGLLGRRILLQHTSLAGFRHHAAPQLWPALRRHALLTLTREADNPHDGNAVALYWRGRKLGYVPRAENLVVARLLDRRRSLSARIEALSERGERNQRIRVAILMH